MTTSNHTESQGVAAIAPTVAPIHPAGSVVTRDAHLSFVSRAHTKRGRFLGASHFDVPPEDYAHGWITGTKAAAELLAAMRDNENFDALSCLREAGSVALGDGRYGAAVGFLRAVEDMLRAAATHLRHEQFFARKIEELQHNMESRRQREAAEDAQKARAFVERMKAGKAAKLQAKEVRHG